jgi:hypothetical protein
MAESGSRRRVRLLVALVAVWVVLRIVTVAVFRKRNPLALAVVRRFNGRYLNSVMLRLAGSGTGTRLAWSTWGGVRARGT